MKNANLQALPRPPIVVVLGHVDHGKTTLLDRIRKTDIASHEAGGITQSIGAWQVKTADGHVFTFIDTPGHEAFSAMRARGAKLADLAILVVAADDGVAPQTKESIKYLNEAQTPFLVAITKTDVPNSRPEVVKNQLAQEGVLLEGRGGDVVCLSVSAKTGQGIDELLEMLTIFTSLHEIQDSPEGSLDAVVIEAKKDAKRGPVVLLVMRSGTLTIGEEVTADGISCRVRGLFDQNSRPVQEVHSGMPAEVLGFSVLPPVGSVLKERLGGKPQAEEKELVKVKKVEGFPIILKTDTKGGLEAVKGELPQDVGLLLESIGDITESDVALAIATSATIVGFGVKAAKAVEKFAQEHNVKLHLYKIIYQLLQDVDVWMKEAQEEAREKILGRAEVIASFAHDKDRIAGCRLLEGKLAKVDTLRLVRGKVVIGDIKAVSIKKQKEEVNEVTQGEFGIFFLPQFDFVIGDVIESYRPAKSASNSV